jgi:hypothetical protein
VTLPAGEAARGAPWVALGAAGLAAVGSSGGVVTRLACAALALVLVALALRVRRRPDAGAARALAAAALGVALLGAALLLGGRPGAGPALLAAAAMLAWVAARLARSFDPGSPEPVPVGLRALAATTLDEAALWLRELRAGRPGRGTAAIDTSLCRVVLERQRARGWHDDPERVHPLPPPLEKAVLAPAAAPGLGSFESLAFESEWQAAEPELREACRGSDANRIARAWLWREPGAARPALLLVPGHGGGRVDLDARLLGAARLGRDLGIDVVLPVLPFHGLRADAGRAGFLHRDPLFAAAALGQAVWELRRLAGWLRAQGAPAVGVAGAGIGGTLAALLASLDGALACAVPAFAPLSARSLCAEGRREAWAAGAGDDVVEALLSLCSPLRLAPRAPAAGRLVVGARADRFVLPGETEALAAHWQAPLLWMPGGHVWPGSPRRLREAVAAHLRRTLCVRSQVAEPPLSHFRR